MANPYVKIGFCPSKEVWQWQWWLINDNVLLLLLLAVGCTFHKVKRMASFAVLLLLDVGWSVVCSVG
jgi:hypothetical protein